MTQTQHTPGPWAWRKMGDSLALATDGRGCIIVMDFVRQGMRGAQPRFGTHRSEKDRGGLLAPADKIDVATHPDARLIEAAPELLESLDNVTAALETCLAWFGDKMTEADRHQRTKLAGEARKLILEHRPDEPTCGTCGAACSPDDTVTCPACEVD